MTYGLYPKSDQDKLRELYNANRSKAKPRSSLPRKKANRREIAKMFVVDEQNDYLECERVDGDGQTEYVAKPYKLRHNADNYSEASAITTVSVNQVTATVGGDSESWVIAHTYQVGDPILVVWDDTGVQAGDTNIYYLDMNVDARHWAEDT